MARIAKYRATNPKRAFRKVVGPTDTRALITIFEVEGLDARCIEGLRVITTFICT
jgi:hypothetical protein